VEFAESISNQDEHETDSAHTHTHTFNVPFSGTTRVSRYQKGKANLDFTEARDSEWQWHQLGHMQDRSSVAASGWPDIDTPSGHGGHGWGDCTPSSTEVLLPGQRVII